MPRTDAHVPPGRRYDAATEAWIGTPARVERMFVEALGTEVIPENYIDDFWGALHEIENKIASQQDCEFTVTTWVIRITIECSDQERSIAVVSLVTRPCAERRGFAATVLSELIGVAWRLGYKLFVEHPMPNMVELLKKHFGLTTAEWGIEARIDQCRPVAFALVPPAARELN